MWIILSNYHLYKMHLIVMHLRGHENLHLDISNSETPSDISLCQYFIFCARNPLTMAVDESTLAKNRNVHNMSKTTYFCLPSQSYKTERVRRRIMENKICKKSSEENPRTEILKKCFLYTGSVLPYHSKNFAMVVF